MPLWKEFKAFAIKGNVVDLAVAVVIGTAFGKIVTALVDGVVMPLVGKALPNKDWQQFAVAGIRIGAVLGSVLDFLIVAAVLFIVVVKLIGGIRRVTESPAAPTTKACAECLEEIPLAARRCRACTSQQPQPG